MCTMIHWLVSRDSSTCRLWLTPRPAPLLLQDPLLSWINAATHTLPIVSLQHVKRDLFVSKETCTHPKRPICRPWQTGRPALLRRGALSNGASWFNVATDFPPCRRVIGLPDATKHYYCGFLIKRRIILRRPITFLNQCSHPHIANRQPPSCQKRPLCIKRDLYVSKETHICQKRPIFVKRDSYQKTPMNIERDRYVSKRPMYIKKDSYIKRDLYISKETEIDQKRLIHQKRPLHIKRDLYISKETYTYQKRRKKETLHSHDSFPCQDSFTCETW